MHKPSFFVMSVVSAVGLAACGDEAPTPAEIRARISSDLRHVLVESHAALDGATTAMPGAAALGVIERFLGQSDGEIAARARIALGALRAAPPADEPYDPDAQIAVLTDAVFTDKNHRGDGIFVVPPDLVCKQVAFDPQTGEPTESVDPECTRQLEAAQLRIRVAADDGALRFALQLGAAHDEPLSIGLTHDGLSLTVDLDDASRAAVALAGILGADLPNAALSGQLTGSLTILGPAQLRAALTIDRALSIAVAEQGVALDGPEAFRFTSDKADLASLALDGHARTGSLTLGVGATTANVPSERGAHGLDLPGLTAVAMFGADRPMMLTHLGLGARSTVLTVGGVPAIAIDLNPADGRAVGATITHDPASGTDRIEVAPVFDLRTTIDRDVLVRVPPVYDITRVLVDGSVRVGGDRIQVLTGELAIHTDPASYGVAAAAGQCVDATEAYDDVHGAFYTQWTAGSCQ
ncbi:MAG: hypothetical protein ACTHU0_21005 [Kofleriaceae bacterium]